MPATTTTTTAATTRNGSPFTTAPGVIMAIQWCLRRARSQRAWATGRPTAGASRELAEAEDILDGQGLLTGVQYLQQAEAIAATRRGLGL